MLITVDLSSERDCFVDLIHPTRDDHRFVVERVRLISTTPTLGGRRWWFLYPKTDRHRPEFGPIAGTPVKGPQPRIVTFIGAASAPRVVSIWRRDGRNWP
jgi:hypothetical protein